AGDKNELDPPILGQADRFVCDRVTQSVKLGEMRRAIATGVLAPNATPDELGAICAGDKPGRRTDTEITVCDLTGTGVQDTAIAVHALTVARSRDRGQIVQN